MTAIVTRSIPFPAYLPPMAIPINEDPYSYPPSYYDDPDDEPPPAPRYRPQSITDICAITKFTKREIQIMYRAFKQGCPCGTIMLPQFQEIYAQFFPQGNANKYAEYVFKTFDRDEDGMINFEEFVVGLSVISRGTNTEKLEWIFDLYDINKKGCIRQTELMLVVQSIYELLGRHTNPPISKRAVVDHVVDVFKKIDKNDDGIVTRQEFVEICKSNKLLCDSLKLFDTRL
uniref:EF-hand domain-containing protein n=1 Tax=Parascaris univalens TaxID=6257 RepID=A0A914ZRT7_PARUN